MDWLHSNRRIKGRGGVLVFSISRSLLANQRGTVLSNYVTGECVWRPFEEPEESVGTELIWETCHRKTQGPREGNGGLSGSHICFVDFWEVFENILFKLCALRGLSIHIQQNTLILRNINDENIQCVLSQADPRSLTTRPSAPGLGILTCVLRSEGWEVIRG